MPSGGTACARRGRVHGDGRAQARLRARSRRAWRRVGFLASASEWKRAACGRRWACARGVHESVARRRGFESRPVRHFFEGLTRLSTYCGDLGELSASAALAQMALGQGGVTYVDHGWRSMIRNLQDYARSLGVAIEAGNACGKRGGPAVLAVGPAEVQKITGVALKTTPIKMATLDIALGTHAGGRGEVWLGARPAAVFLGAFDVGEGGASGERLWFTSRSTPRRRTDGELEAFADLLMPGWRELVVHARFLPDMTVTHAVPGVGGPAGRGCVGD